MQNTTPKFLLLVFAASAVAAGWALFVYSQSVIQVGYLTVTADPGNTLPVGSGLFAYSNNGVLVSQAGVPSAEPTRTGRIFVDESGATTGLALVNSSGQDVAALLTLRDGGGNEVLRQPLVLSSGQHLSRYVREMFSNVPAGFVGSLTFESNRPLAALTLREVRNAQGEPLYSTLPLVDFSTVTTDPVVFPHLAAGDGYTTQLILLNRSGQRIRGQVRLFASDGGPLLLQTAGSTVAEFVYEIEPNGVYRVELESPSLSVGYAVAIPDAGNSAPAGTAIFQFKAAGQVVSEAGVGATGQTSLARIFADNAGTQTGLAIANPGNQPATLNLSLMDRFGVIEGTTVLTIPSGGHKAAFLHEFFPGLAEGFTGVVEISSSVPIAPITLKLTVNTRNQMILTTLPVADLTRPPAGTTLIFPQVAYGGGFSTNLIFIHQSRTEAASVGLRFYQDDGTPLSLVMGGLQSSQFSYRFSAGSARRFLPGNAARVASITLLDASNRPTTEFTINEGNKARPRIRILDATGAARDDFDVDYASTNPDVASITEGVITGRARGFATLAISAGGLLHVAVATVTGVGSGVPGYEVTGIAPAAERLYLAATGQHTVLLAQRLTDVPGIYAGTPQVAGLKNDFRLLSQFRSPAFLAINRATGTLYVSDSANNVIRSVNPQNGGRVETLAGTGASGSDGGQAIEATFRNPQGIALDDRGQLWVADSDNHTIRRINLRTGRVEIVAGEAGSPGLADGVGPSARFRSPMGIAVEPDPAVLDLERRNVELQAPRPVHVLVADSGNNAIRRVYDDGRVETVGAVPSALMDGGGGFSKPAASDRFLAGPLVLNRPTDVAADSFGTIYVTEPATKQVRAILANGNVVAAAEANTFSKPAGIAVSQTGRIVVGDARLQEIRYGEPQITSVTPNRVSARGGNRITIRGKNFAPGTLIVAGDVVISAFAADQSNTETITLVTPPLPSGRTTLTLQNRGGLAQSELLVDAVPLAEIPAGYITTVAGGSTFTGDGGFATAAPATPSSIVLDANGNILIADAVGHRIRRVNARSGIITSIAGNGLYSFSGDNGPAIIAGLDTPSGIAVDGSGNLFIADSYNNRIRRVDARSGVITTVAGTGLDAFTGDGGPAAAASLSLPSGLAIDTAGNLFLADTLNNRVRRIDAAGTITTVAGDGQPRFAGDNGPGRSASLNRPHGVAIDRAGNLFIADQSNQRIRKLSVDGIITTVAGNGEGGFSPDGTLALAASLAGPMGVFVDVDGNLFIAENDSARVRKVSASDSRMTTVAGTGEFRYNGDGVLAGMASLDQPRGVTVDAEGNVFIADYWNRRVRRVDAKTGTISTVAGNGQGAFLGEDGPATLAVINYPEAIIFDGSGNLFVGDSDNRVRKVDMTTGIMTIVAGGGGASDGLGDGGPATEADIWEPSGLAFDRDGNLYVSDTWHARVRKVDARTNTITTIAGTGNEGFSGDGGPATLADLREPRALAVDANQNLLIADEGNLRLRRVNLATGTITTVVGNGLRGFSGDTGPANLASVTTVRSFALDSLGNIYLAEYESERIRRVDSMTGTINTIAGGGMLDSNNVRATDAAIAPIAISIAPDGRIFIMDLVRQGVARIDAAGFMSLVAGDGVAGFSGDNGPAIAASLTYPLALAFDRFGNLFVADSNNNRIRAIRGPLP